MSSASESPTPRSTSTVSRVLAVQVARRRPQRLFLQWRLPVQATGLVALVERAAANLHHS